MEQNYDKFGPWTDIYALGATLYTMLSNKRPPLPTDIDDDNSEDKHISLPFPDDVSVEMKQMVLWMMKTNRSQRPQDVDSILLSLPVAIQEESVEKEAQNEETILTSEESHIDVSIESLIQQAEKGDADAQFKLGRLYDKGESVEEDKEEAFEWYMKAAKQGNADAQFYVAWSYMNGEGVNENKVEAFRWYKKSAERGNVSAQNNLACCFDNGDGVEMNKEKAFEWFKKSAERGNDVAQNNLGDCYYSGKGVIEDKQEALKWYKKAAEQGNSDAQYNLGLCYDKGFGIGEDKQKAFGWFLESAEQENADAQYNLALYYNNGIGVNEDRQEALEWYKKAANNGNRDAIDVVKPLLKKHLRKRRFYTWRRITLFASWFSAYFFLCLGIGFIGVIVDLIKTISGIIGIDIGFSLEGLRIPDWLMITICSLFVLSLFMPFLLHYSSKKQSDAFYEACKDSGIFISIEEVDNCPYLVTINP